MTLPLWCNSHNDRDDDSRRARRYVALLADGGERDARDTRDVDTALWEHVRTGQDGAFEALYRAHVPRLLDFAERYVSADVAEDLVHSVMAAVWHRRHALNVRTTVAAYLFGAVHREVLMYERHQRVVRADVARATSEAPPSPPATDADASWDELRAAFRDAIDALPARTRDVLTLRWVEELRYDEIAEVLGMSESAAKMHVHRAQPIVLPLLERFRK